MRPDNSNSYNELFRYSEVDTYINIAKPFNGSDSYDEIMKQINDLKLRLENQKNMMNRLYLVTDQLSNEMRQTELLEGAKTSLSDASSSASSRCSPKIPEGEESISVPFKRSHRGSLVTDVNPLLRGQYQANSDIKRNVLDDIRQREDTRSSYVLYKFPTDKTLRDSTPILLPHMKECTPSPPPSTSMTASPGFTPPEQTFVVPFSRKGGKPKTLETPAKGSAELSTKTQAAKRADIYRPSVYPQSAAQGLSKTNPLMGDSVGTVSENQKGDSQKKESAPSSVAPSATKEVDEQTQLIKVELKKVPKLVDKKDVQRSDKIVEEAPVITADSASQGPLPTVFNLKVNQKKKAEKKRIEQSRSEEDTNG